MVNVNDRVFPKLFPNTASYYYRLLLTGITLNNWNLNRNAEIMLCITSYVVGLLTDYLEMVLVTVKGP